MTKHGQQWNVAGTERRVKTLRLPETCKDDLAEDDGEGVDDEGMMIMIQPALESVFK